MRKSDNIINDLLNYYLFEYEIAVYPKYTELTPQMIENKMYHFWMLLKKSGYKDRVKKIIAAFYHSEGKGGKFIVLNSVSPDKPSVRSFSTVPPVTDVIKPSERVIFVPYYLFKNNRVDEVQKKLKNGNIDPHNEYVRLIDKIDFIWREAFRLKSITSWETEVREKQEKYKNAYSHGKTYQDLWCIIVFKDNRLPIKKQDLSHLSDSFAMTIKEWGLDSLRQEIIQHGTRAAVTAIMGRNMSHNIGSHVLSYWTRQLKKWEITSPPLKDVCSMDRFFFDYLRSRMDFIAEISTTNPAWTSTMMFCQDILCHFLKQRVLLNYLVMSENIHLEPCNKIGCNDSESHHLLCFEVYRNGSMLFGLKSEANTLKYQSDVQASWTACDIMKPIKVKNDISIAVPHGITGVHAFYSILENFIRNSAKHGKINLQGIECFKVIIKIEDGDNDLVKVSISDNLGNCDEQIIEKLNTGLSERLVKNDGTLKSGNWGLKEKKISACFLRMGGPEDVDRTSDFPPIWSIIAKGKGYFVPSCRECKPSENCKVPHVKYEFYLLKPKEALIIGAEKGNEAMGIFTVEKAQFTKGYIKGGVPHRFLITSNDGSIGKIISEGSEYLPLRIIELDKINSGNDVYFYYKKWLQAKYNNYPVNIEYGKNETRGLCFKDNGFISYQETATLSNDSKKLIVYDDHGDRKRCRDEITGLLYYQSVSGANAIKRLLLNLEYLDDIKRKILYCELTEAALTKVLIADERVWEANSEVSRLDDLLYMNIGVVCIRNKRADIGEIRNFLIQFKPHFFIIHQGLLDKMNPDERKDCDCAVKNNNATYVISSGRGLPNSLRHGARFLEISALERFINEDDKHGLVQVLYSLRRYRDGNI